MSAAHFSLPRTGATRSRARRFRPRSSGFPECRRPLMNQIAKSRLNLSLSFLHFSIEIFEGFSEHPGTPKTARRGRRARPPTAWHRSLTGVRCALNSGQIASSREVKRSARRRLTRCSKSRRPRADTRASTPENPIRHDTPRHKQVRLNFNSKRWFHFLPNCGKKFARPKTQCKVALINPD
jgi:hypothetical protein